MTSREWFAPPPSEALFDDKHHWANCVIEHEELHELKNQMQGGNSTSNVAGSRTIEPEAERLKHAIN